MYKLVVFFAVVAVTASHVVAPAPLVRTYASAPVVAQAPVVSTYTAHAVPAFQTYSVPAVHAIAAPAVHTYSSPAVAISHAITKQVHYESRPVVTGYSSQILKPNLGALATPLAGVTQERVLAPARTVATVHPQVTQVQPELHVRKVPVDVPVAHPYISEVEVRQPAPIIAHTPVIAAPAAPAVVSTYAAHAVPAVVAAPAVVSSYSTHAAHGVVAHPHIYSAGIKSYY